MLRWKRFCALVVGIGFYLGGCADVAFDSKPSASCVNAVDQYGDDACVQTTDGYNTYKYSVRYGDVDILVVNDNSGSMREEQEKMGEKFGSFLSTVSHLNYQIAMTTTDSYAQKGKFLKFQNGDYILTPETPGGQELFNKAVRRDETIECRDYGRNCPTADERGIYALNLALDRGDKKFFRRDAHLAVIIISDEDERSREELRTKGYPLEEYDLPETFVSKVRTQLGSAKSVSVHSIIIHPKYPQCLVEQDAQTDVIAAYGMTYAALSEPSDELKKSGNLVDGHIGNICAPDYTTELGDIGSKVAKNSAPITLPCEPVKDSVKLEFVPAPAQQIIFDVEGNKVLLDPGVDAGTEVFLEFKCPRSA